MRRKCHWAGNGGLKFDLPEKRAERRRSHREKTDEGSNGTRGIYGPSAFTGERAKILGKSRRGQKGKKRVLGGGGQSAAGRRLSAMLFRTHTSWNETGRKER